MLRKLYITLSFIFLLHGALFAQDENKANTLFKSAKTDYESLKYGPAIKAFEIVVKEHPDYTSAIAMLADSYRNIQDYDNAVKWYAKLTGSDTAIKPEWALHYAEVLANTKQYKESAEWYTKYAGMNKNDSRALGFAKLYQNIAPLFAHQKEWQIAYLNLNTLGSEFSPTYFNNGLMFTSNRKGKGISSHVFEWDETPFSDLYFVKNLSEIKGLNVDSIRDVLRKQLKDSGKKLYQQNDDDTDPTSNDSKIVGLYIAKMLKDTVGDYLSTLIDVKPMPGDINSKYHDGPAAVLPDGSLIFNRNNYFHGKYAKSKEGINKLKLFTAKGPDYTEITDFPYNNDQYSVGHPTVNKAGTLLIFTSDMPNGVGGADLYYCKRATTKDAWNKPVNMGNIINTEGGEFFPTLYQDSVLYFSSNGHPGLGGLDIFKVTLNGVIPINTPTNLGAPINSSVDDFGLIKNETGTSGYFSSNRKGSDDIYSFARHPFNIRLKGLIVDADTEAPIENSMVAVRPAGKAYFQTGVSGTFARSLTENLVYSITAVKDGYASAAGTVSTLDIISDTVLTITLKLQKPKVVPIGPVAVHSLAVSPAPLTYNGEFTSNCDSLKKVIDVKNIYYDFDKSFIRDDEHAELSYIIKVLKAHPSFQLIIGSHCDSRASEPYNQALSMRRSKAAYAYLMAHGIAATRMRIEYYGKSRLTIKCADGVPCTEAEQQMNRRTEFTFLKNGKDLKTIECNLLQKYLENK